MIGSRALGVIAALGCLLLGCRRATPKGERPIASSAPARPAPSIAPPAVRGCSALQVRGSATSRGASGDAVPIVAGPIANDILVDVGDDSELTLRTGAWREVTVRGPARAMLCPDGNDEVRLSRGRASAFPGIGVKPGSDVWVTTPLGIVRFDEANLAIDVSPAGDRVVLRVAAGRAEFVANVLARSPKALEPIPVAAGDSLEVERAPAVDAGALDPSCARESAAARASERLLSAGGDAGSLGERAAAHVRATQRARAACESAKTAALGAGQGK